MKNLAFALVFLCAAAASAGRLPMQMDFDRCTLAAENRGVVIQGRIRMELLVNRGGTVYGAFIHSSSGIDDSRFQHCLTNAALLWELPAVPVDYERPYPLTFVHGGTELDYSPAAYQHGDSPNVPGRTSAFMPDMNDPAPLAPVDPELARSTLDLLDKATEAERGTGLLAVHDYEKAVPAFHAALERDSTDPVALRGLAHALSYLGTDLKEARAAAEKLAAISPSLVSGHEALLHACLALRDDDCAVAQFRAAKNATDMAPRSRMLAELQDQVRAAGQRLASAQGAQPADECAAQDGEGAQALCVVKRCLDEGTSDYAKELSAQNHIALSAGDWHEQRVAKDRYVVHRPIDGAGEHHDAMWLVTVGDELTMKPASSEARQITLRHNRCAARTLGSR